MELEERNKSFTISNGDILSKYTAPDTINTTELTEPKQIEKQQDDSSTNHDGHGLAADRPTTYIESLMHLLRGNIGAGAFAMGDAFKNGGLLLSPICTIILGIICVHSQHILIKCSKELKEKLQLKQYPDFAQTVELSFQHGPLKLRKYSTFIKHLVNMFLCVTQVGFSCVYIVFIGNSCKQMFDYYGYEFDVHLHMLIFLLPILLLSIIPNLKLLAPCSAIANISMAIGFGVVFYYAIQDMPNVSERKFVGEISNFPLYYGTVIYAFEGIALVLPIKNSMKCPQNFNKTFGVLNVGMTFVVTLFTVFGFFGYLKWGEDVEGSLTLNLPPHDILAQVVKVLVSFGMLLTYPLQFYIAVQILWSYVNTYYGPFNKNPKLLQIIFRSLMVLGSFAIAELVPHLNLFISLIGALCATALALVFPPLIQLISTGNISTRSNILIIVKNCVILILALFGFITGTYESLSNIIRSFIN